MRHTGRAGAERGSASIWVLVCGALVLAVAVLGSVRVAAVTARHRAERAADLTALAAAEQIGRGGAVCAAAAAIATANSVRLTGCVPVLDAARRSGSVRVTVAGSIALPLLGARTVAARARAGRSPPLPPRG